MNTSKQSSEFLSSFQSFGKNTFNKLKASSGSNYVVYFIAILIILFLAYYLYQFYLNYSQFQIDQPYLIKDTISCTSPVMINAKAVPEPYDGKYGMEYTIATWMYIDSASYSQYEGNGSLQDSNFSNMTQNYFHVFHKGENKDNPSVFQPAVWLSKSSNVLTICLSEYPWQPNQTSSYSFAEKFNITNLPLDKWFHLVIVIMDKNMDVYINGNLKLHQELHQMPKWNYGNVYFCRKGGFLGNLSRVRYFNYAIAPYQIEQLMNMGPSDKPCINSGELPPYLASDYWFSN
jgi:hypothetical protein